MNNGHQIPSRRAPAATPAKLMLATPCYHAEVSCNFLFSLLTEIPRLLAAGVQVKLEFQIGDAVNRQRNCLAGKFLESACTHLLFIDSDTGWRAGDILRMLAADKPVTGVNYPQRTYLWDNAGGETIDELRDSLLKGSVAPWSEMTELPGADSLVEVAYVGTGIMLIRRDVLESIVERGLVARLAKGRHRFFQFTVVATGPDEFDDRGEDYSFCDLVRSAGYSIWCDPQARATHQGLHVWEGNPAFLAPALAAMAQAPATVPINKQTTDAGGTQAATPVAAPVTGASATPVAAPSTGAAATLQEIDHV